MACPGENAIYQNVINNNMSVHNYFVFSNNITTIININNNVNSVHPLD